ncbi:MAG: Plug domain-containing protein, partial [Duncaniella sp.]|nr:Plug domain-containing protein [Duncaniella sp.]
MITNNFILRYIRCLSCVAVPVLALVPQICRAQTPSTIELDTVEVVQTHTTKSIKSSAPVFNLNEKEFNRLGVTDISDAIHRLPGVNLRDYGG